MSGLNAFCDQLKNIVNFIDVLGVKATNSSAKNTTKSQTVIVE